MLRCNLLAYAAVDPTVPHPRRRAAMCPKVFGTHLDYLASNGYVIVSLSQVADAFAGRWALPERAVALTFDGDPRLVLETYQPALEHHGFGATVFVREPAAGPFVRLPDWRSVVDGGLVVGHAIAFDAGPRESIGTDLIATLARAKARIEEAAGTEVLHGTRRQELLAGPSRRLVSAMGYRTVSHAGPDLMNRQLDPLNLRRVTIDAEDDVRRFAWKLWRSTKMPAMPGESRMLAA
jgi:hypothetical protein